jgi:type IV secretion system protein VirD4
MRRTWRLLIVDPDGKGLRADNHWQKTAYSLLVGCILHLCYKGKVERTPATFTALDQMLADSSRPIQKLWNEMLTYGHTTAEIILLFLRPRAT